MIIYNPMTLKEAIPVVLVMFTLVCALPATVISPPSAIAQEEDDDEAENLASDTVSNVLDNGSTFGDNTNTNTDTQLSVPITDQDQTDANIGLSEALDVVVERTLSTPPRPDDGQLPPPEDEDVFFCVEDAQFGILCFDTPEECEIAEGLAGVFLVSECDEFETPPSDAAICRVEGSETVVCDPDPF